MLMSRNGSNVVIFRYRIIIAFLLLVFVYYYYHQRSELARTTDYARSQIAACKADSESVLTKLQVFYRQKEKVENQLIHLSDVTNFTIQGLRKNLTTCGESIKDCQAKLNRMTKENLEKSKETQKETDKIGSQELISKLQNEVETLKMQLAEQQKTIGLSRTQQDETKTALAECRKTVENYVGAVPVAHYTQNETASFQRKHKIGEELSFDRNAIEVHNPGQLLNGRELAEKIAEKKKILEKEENVHPEEREEQDAYVHEVPNKEELDYKEGP